MPVGVAFRSLMAAAGVGSGPWDVIASSTLGSPAASISFASIASTYKLFRVTAYIIKDGSAGRALVRLNNDSGANYERQRLSGAATGVSAQRTTGETSWETTWSGLTSQPATFELVIGKQIAGAAAMGILSSVGKESTTLEYSSFACRWNNTADLINRIDIIASAGNFAAGTVVVLEGLAD